MWHRIDDPDNPPPKDGTEILVCEPRRTMAVVFWVSGDYFLDEEEWVPGWYISDGKNDPIWYRNHPYVTHWQPLPPPPAEDTP